MSDNLVFLINKLSYQIAVTSLNNENNSGHSYQFERYLKKCIAKLRRRGCDVLLGKISSEIQDPCLTDYGGNWSPFTLLADYGKDLLSKGSNKQYEILLSGAKILEEREYDIVNEILKFLLIMKGYKNDPNVHKQNDISSLSSSEFLLPSINSLLLFLDEPLPLIQNSFSRQSTYKKALKYEESWTKSFDSKFQVLGEYSRKNLLIPEKVSFDSLFSVKPALTSQSQSNCFVFTDICVKKSWQSEKNIFEIGSSSCMSDIPLLDSFVDTPINHELPKVFIGQKDISRSSYFMKSNNPKQRLHFVEEEGIPMVNEEGSINKSLLSKRSLTSAHELVEEEEELDKRSTIQLKRNSNCSHSFAILYEKASSYKASSISSNDNLLVFKDRVKNKIEKKYMKGTESNSKEIILGLWELDKSLIQEFRPELAGTLPTLRMIPIVEYVEDVKYLLTGINSETFKYTTEENCFNMKYGTCLTDVTPESLYHFSKEFIEIGNYYTKLSAYATENGKTNIDACTTISQGFWKSIFDYLELHYSMVIAIPCNTNLIMLKSSVRNIQDIIIAMWSICKAVKENELLEGGQLLTYLLQVVEKLFKPCVRNIVFAIIQSCCSIYFRCILQPWIFNGQLDKQNNEFFITCNKQRVMVKNRTYYNSFSITKDKIPSFLLGYEDNIFNCGKSIHFLKLFNLDDKFCHLLEKSDYPKMRICLSEGELFILEREFKEYQKKVVTNCGKHISIKDLQDEEKEKEKLFQEYVKNYKKKIEEDRKIRKLRELKELKEKKELQNKLLNEEMNRMREERERRKLEEEIAMKKLEEKIKKVAKSERHLIRQERGLIEKYYSELLKTLDQQMSFIETKKKHLQKILAADFSLEDLQFENNILDVLNDNNVNKNNSIDEKQTESQSVDLNLNTIIIEEAQSEESIPEDSVTNVLENNGNIVSADENLNICPINSKETITENVTEEKKLCSLKNLDYSLQNIEKKLRKCVSQHTAAAREAVANKMKVLQSEFDIQSTKNLKSWPNFKSHLIGETTSVKPNTYTSITSINSEYQCDSEYSILKCESDVIPIKPATPLTEIVKEVTSLSEKTLASENVKTTDSSNYTEGFNHNKVNLERKQECLNLENISDSRNSENFEVVQQTSHDDSLCSFLTPPTGTLSEDNNTVAASEADVIIVSSQSIATSGVFAINPKYQNALIKDSEISNHELSYADFFKGLNQAKFGNTTCTDLIKFQRFLKRSALIPLVIQEKLANDALLNHLLISENLLAHLKSLRAYYFLNDGEFGRYFTHNIFRSLSKCTEAHEFFERSNLSTIVNEALNYAIRNEPNSQNLSFQIVKMPPFLNHASHDVLNPFELSYKVDWPLNVIITDKALEKYKSIFKFLLKLKRISWTLNENSLFLNSYHKCSKLNRHVLVCSPHYHKIQIYRHAMTQVIITLDDYIFSNGIQIPWLNFLKDMETVENIDHLYQKHVQYIKDILMRCFLTKASKDLLNCIHSVLELSLRFHYTITSTPFAVNDGRYEHPKFSILRSTFNEFCSVTKTFLRTLKVKIASNQVIKSHYILIEKFDLKLT